MITKLFFPCALTSKINLYEISLLGINVIPPVSYLEMQGLLTQADLVLTDSGGLQKEAYFHGVDCITLRDETEWQKLLTAVGTSYGKSWMISVPKRDTRVWQW